MHVYLHPLSADVCPCAVEKRPTPCKRTQATKRAFTVKAKRSCMRVSFGLERPQNRFVQAYVSAGINRIREAKMIKSHAILYLPHLNISMPTKAHISMPTLAHISMPTLAHISTSPTLAHISLPPKAHISIPTLAHISMPTVAHISTPRSAHISMPMLAHISMP